MTTRIVLCLLVLTTAAAAGAAESGKSATAKIIDSLGKTLGTAHFSEKNEGVEVTVKVSGLPPGKHGIHLHEQGKCDPPGFSTAGGHFNPSAKQHGSMNPGGKHAGDLPNLMVKADGTAEFTATAKGATLGDGGGSLLKKGGTSIIIHAGPDDEKTDPSGNSGGRIACGVVTAQ
ncbi:superoxide dismutase family protein [Geobacter sp. SVR]|uniref:superoxide dismutase family protein n=1 Tax=Geobacter sp. SVR TaxID=2495594 RepID=UPI0015670BC5|nr:superoxide dismutase family protein [Geobacter sp. SVR]